MPRTELRMNSEAEEDIILAGGIARRWRLQERSKLTKKITLVLSNFLAVSETELELREMGRWAAQNSLVKQFTWIPTDFDLQEFHISRFSLLYL